MVNEKAFDGGVFRCGEEERLLTGSQPEDTSGIVNVWSGATSDSGWVLGDVMSPIVHGSLRGK